MTWIPSLENVLTMHDKLIARTGGAGGVRSMGLIESALNRAIAAFGGVDAYSGSIQKAAAVACGLVQNHGFVDGNKRIGIATMLLMLEKNGIHISFTQQELVALGLDMATNNATPETVASWIGIHSLPLM